MSVDPNPKTHVSNDWREKPLNLPRLNETQHVAAWMVVGALVLMVIGYGIVNGAFDIVTALDDFYANISSELLSIAATVFIIDRLNDRRAKKETEAREKADLILQMGSDNNAFAREAAGKLSARGWLKDGSLQGASLWDANLEGENLFGANMKKAKLRSANLNGVILNQANLQEANLDDASLQGAFLEYAYLQRAFLQGAQLQKANLFGAHLNDAKLQNAQLMYANLVGVDFRGADLRGANLSGADLSQACLIGARLKPAGFDLYTKLPDETYWSPDVDMSRFTGPQLP